MRLARGFTLIELLVAISIISLLSSIVLASINTAREKGRFAAARQQDAVFQHTIGDQLIGWWPFDDCTGTAVANVVPYAYTAQLATGLIGAYTGSNPTWVNNDSPFGKGCSLDFSIAANTFALLDGNDYANANAGTYGVGPGATRTYTAWFKLNSTGNATNMVLWKAGSCAGWWIVVNANGTVTGIHQTTTGFANPCSANVNYVSVGITSTKSYPNNLWHFVALSINRSTGQAKLYVDSELVASSASINTSSTYAGNGQFVVGNDWQLAQPFRGKIDDVRAYSSDLSLIAIQDLYREGRATHLARESNPVR